MKSYHSLSATIAFHAATSSVDLGNAGERLAIALFKDNGFLAEKESEKFKGDIRVVSPTTGEVIKVEVKTARKAENGRERWQFCLNRDGMTSCLYSDFCLLFAVLRGGVAAYLVPKQALGKLKVIEISNPKKYKGKLAKFKIDHASLSFEKAIELHELSVIS